jgi:hypothetical protein
LTLWFWALCVDSMAGTSRIVAIHQPNFFPWLGYFNKLACADVLVLLDSVQFPKTGGTWTNRVRLKMGGQPRWVTVPVDRAFHGVRPIREIRTAGFSWRRELLRTIEVAYGRAAHFGEVYPVLAELVRGPADLLAEYNIGVIRALASVLGLGRTRLVRSSDLGAVGKATDLLVELVRSVGGTTYLCGGGARGYQDDVKLAAAGVDLIYQGFRHPVYPQLGSEFISGLSIIDTLLNCGIEPTRQLLLGIPPSAAGSSAPADAPQAEESR